MIPHALTRNRGARSERLETCVIWGLLVAVGLLRAFYIFHAKVDSDEPQHLHVAWGWTHGLLQYRDLFDNHTPLFHLLMAPVLSAMGEREDIIICMRWVMVPLFAFCLWSVYRIGKRLYSPEAGRWAAVLAAFFPKFFFVSGQFRSDDLWVALWLAALVVLVEGKFSTRRSFYTGVLLGLTVACSLKTTLLLVALFSGVVAVALLNMRLRQRGLEWWRLRVVVFALGILVAPLSLCVFYYAHGALGPLFQNTVFHNFAPKLGHWKHLTLAWMFVPEVLALGWITWKLWSQSSTAALARRRVIIFLAGGAYLALLCSFWPLLAPESFLPVYPIAGVFVGGLLCSSHMLARRRVYRGALIGGLVLSEAAAIILLQWPMRNGTIAETKLLHDVLRLTGRDQYVMDGKGETVFRRRPFYPIFEHITRNRISQHLIEDSLPEDLVATRTCVVTSFHPFTARDVAFIERNYVKTGPLSVVGQVVTSTAGAIRFTIEIPATYTVIDRAGTVTGELDGTPFSGSRFLAAGEHRFVAASSLPEVAVIWSRAIELGFSPFTAEPWSIPVVY